HTSPTPFYPLSLHDALPILHYYLPGWEIPKMRPDFFTNRYGFIVDYIAEYFREMRKRSYTDAIDKYFKLGTHLNQRDTIAVRKTDRKSTRLNSSHVSISYAV